VSISVQLRCIQGCFPPLPKLGVETFFRPKIQGYDEPDLEQADCCPSYFVLYLKSFRIRIKGNNKLPGSGLGRAPRKIYLGYFYIEAVA
jgi:hypothetical protein